MTPREALAVLAELVRDTYGEPDPECAVALMVLDLVVTDVERTAASAASWVRSCSTPGCGKQALHLGGCTKTMPDVRETVANPAGPGVYLDRAAPADELIPLGGNDPRLPAHLRNDAPMVACSVCERRSVMLYGGRSQVGARCNMTQPSGFRCDGVFAAVTR